MKSRFARACETKPSQLTGREREVVQLIAEGRNLAWIAAELKLSVKTVQGHRASVRRKLGLRTRSYQVIETIITRWASRYGIITVDPSPFPQYRLSINGQLGNKR